MRKRFSGWNQQQPEEVKLLITEQTAENIIQRSERILWQRLVAAIAVALGTIGFMALFLRAAKTPDYVEVFDAKTGTKYRVKTEDYNRNVEKERQRFQRRQEEARRRALGYEDDDEEDESTRRGRKTGATHFAPSRSQVLQQMAYSGRGGPPNAQIENDLANLMHVRQKMLQDNHNELRPSQ